MKSFKQYISEDVTVKDQNKGGKCSIESCKIKGPHRHAKMPSGKIDPVGTPVSEEQLDELSKKTLGSYINKSMKDYGLARRVGANETNPKELKFLNRIRDKRKSGVEKAVSKLTKEDTEQLDELSNKTLGSYVKKVTGTKNNAGDQAHSIAKLIRDTKKYINK